MKEKITVNIIGAGISGLTTGCYLQMNGFETRIYEKHSVPGGLCTSWEKNGFTIDGCAHWILGTDKGSGFYNMWSELLDLEKIPFYNHDVRIHIEVKNNADKYGNKIFKVYNDLSVFENYLIDLAPEDERVIKKFINGIKKLQKYELPPVMRKLPLIPSIIRSVKMTKYLKLLLHLLKEQKVTNYDLAGRFKNPFLRESFELLYDGQKVSMLVFNFPQAVFAQKSAGYPIGGSLKWAKRLADKYISLGGEIFYNTPVKKILTEKNKAMGLLVRNELVSKSDAVVSTADWNKTFFEYLEGKFTNDKMLRLKSEKELSVYYSILLVSFGLKSDYKNQPHFYRFPVNKKLESPCGTSWERIETHFYHYDPTLAPEGKTILACCFYTTNGNYWIDLRKNNRVKYREEKAKFVESLVELLEIKFPGIKEDIEITDFATPATVLRYTNNWKGSTQGWLPGKNMLAKSPVGFTIKGLQNFYYASHWGQPGGGLPVAINQGRDVARLICSTYGKSFETGK